jgi:hypothetical protein
VGRQCALRPKLNVAKQMDSETQTRNEHGTNRMEFGARRTDISDLSARLAPMQKLKGKNFGVSLMHVDSEAVRVI